MHKKFKYTSILRKLFLIFNTALFILLIIFTLAPILKIFNGSIIENGLYDVTFFKGKISFDYYFAFFKEFDRLHSAIITTIFTSLMTVIIGLAVTSISAYILMQKNIPGIKLFGYMLVFTLIFEVGLIPEFLLFKKLGLHNSLWAVIMPLSLNAFYIFLLRSSFEKIPQSVLDAAEIDGCGVFGKFFHIVLPASKAPLTAIGLMFAADAYNEYFRYYMYISDIRKDNLVMYMREWFALDGIWLSDYPIRNLDHSSIMCLNVMIAVIPTLIIYPLLSKFKVNELKKENITIKT